MDGVHVVLFPFMSKGHTIPILHFARLLCRRNISVTVLTTPANRPFIATSLSDTPAAILDLPFPENIPGVPAGVESTDKLPTMSLFVPFANATAAMQPHFELALRNLPDVSFIVTDGFFWWAQESADKLGIPRVVFYGMNGYATTVARAMAAVERTLPEVKTVHELLDLPDFPWIRVAGKDSSAPLNKHELNGPLLDLIKRHNVASEKSSGIIYNSFYELEPAFADYWNRNYAPRGWWVGPLCLAQPPKTPAKLQVRPWWAEWLDGKSVLYVAFGSQAEIPPEQLHEIAVGLERSEVNFMWVTKAEESELPEGYEERVKGRGVIVREWVDQTEILMHDGVRGFLSHCGWNSVMESLCAGVPILTWPMMADQPLNACMLVDELKMGLRMEINGDRTMTGEEGMEKAVRELMNGEKGKEARKVAMRYAEEARKATKEGGSSWRALDSLLNEMTTCKRK